MCLCDVGGLGQLGGDKILGADKAGNSSQKNNNDNNAIK